jgi:hypothetical protein
VLRLLGELSGYLAFSGAMTYSRENYAEALSIRRSLPHGYVAAVLGTVRTIRPRPAARSGRQRCRDLVLAMVVARLLAPASKLATARALDPATAVHSLGASPRASICRICYGSGTPAVAARVH